MAVTQFKIIIFAGHDTTGSTLAFTYAFLDENPHVLAKVREEMDDILGPDVENDPQKILRNPELLNRLAYTTAVIKETLRIIPPVGTIREGNKDFFLKNPSLGKDMPTDGWMMFASSKTMQREAKYFPKPLEFKPERFLAKEGEEFYISKNTWRPFELGPRNCIGQELAMTELKMILALTLRDLDFKTMIPESEPLFYGRRFYQAKFPTEVTAHPKDHMPMKVSLRSR